MGREEVSSTWMSSMTAMNGSGERVEEMGVKGLGAAVGFLTAPVEMRKGKWAGQ